MRVEPFAEFAGGEGDRGQLEAVVLNGNVSLRDSEQLLAKNLELRRLQETLAEHPELKAVEQRVHFIPVRTLQCHVGRSQAQVQITHQPIEVTIANDVPEVGSETLPCLASDLVGPGDDVIEPVELVDPLRRSLGSDSRYAWEIVGILTDQGRQLRIAIRRHAVLGRNSGRRHPGQFGHPTHGVEHRRSLV